MTRTILLSLLLLSGLITSARASNVNPSSLGIPTDPALSFVALGGGTAAVDIAFWKLADYLSYNQEPAWAKNYGVRVGVFVLHAWLVGAVAQGEFGSIRNPARVLGYANFAALGGLGAGFISWSGTW